MQRSGPASAQVGKGCSNNFNYNHHYHQPGPTQHDAAITAACVRVCKEFVCPYTSCSDCCIVLCWSWSVVVVVVECCCCISYQIALMLALTLAPCTCGVILLSASASTQLAHMVVVTGCNLRWWFFFLQPLAQTLLAPWWRHPLQLAVVFFSLPPTGAHIPLALQQLALCGYIYDIPYGP